MEKTVLSFLCLLGWVLILPIQAQIQYPEPQGWVSDFANVLTPQIREELNNLITDVEKQTTAEIAVVTVESTAPLTPKQYATELLNRWKVGKKGKDNGVLILLAVKDRRIEIETGYGVEGILPDGKVGEIIRTYMVPYFKNNRWGEGLIAGTQQIARVILEDTQTSPTSSKKVERRLPTGGFLYLSGWIYFIFWIFYLGIQNLRNRALPLGLLALLTLPGLFYLFFAFFPFIIPFIPGAWASVQNLRNRCPRCGNRMLVQKNTLRPASYSSMGLREVVYTCPVCGYHEVKMETTPRLTRTSYYGPYGGGSFGGFGGSGRSSGGSFGGFGGGSSGGGGAGSSF
ncbi:MAG TPA: TPM domain-containing protein [Candidatus Limnocylindrales bacterium]|nr:TPM domain-containing protein [Candidatus Limnocylindrales bacterium]